MSTCTHKYFYLNFFQIIRFLVVLISNPAFPKVKTDLFVHLLSSVINRGRKFFIGITVELSGKKYYHTFNKWLSDTDIE